MDKSQFYPCHIGFIVDGNRRWAKERGLPTLEGHRRGLKQVERMIEAVAKKGIRFASFYLFSTENWNRTEAEVDYLMDLLRKNLSRLTKKMVENNLKCLILGSEKRVEASLMKKLRAAEKETENCDGGIICFCFNYGGREEIADAAKKIAEENGDFSAENLSKHIYHPEVPDCDLIVRTSGEERLSGFMLWRAAYAELLFLKEYWPEMTPQHLDKILENYQNRSRRFGR